MLMRRVEAGDEDLGVIPALEVVVEATSADELLRQSELHEKIKDEAREDQQEKVRQRCLHRRRRNWRGCSTELDSTAGESPGTLGQAVSVVWWEKKQSEPQALLCGTENSGCQGGISVSVDWLPHYLLFPFMFLLADIPRHTASLDQYNSWGSILYHRNYCQRFSGFIHGAVSQLTFRSSVCKLVSTSIDSA